MLDVRPIRVESLGEKLATELRRRIIVGDVPSGTRLVEEELADSFQVSRGPVRDAIRILRSEGLVTGSGRSAVTRSLSEADIDELMALREAFELLAVERAIAVRREVLARDLRVALVDMDAALAARDSSAFTTADLRFHSAFFAAAGLTRLSVLWDQFRPTIEGLLHASGKRLADLAPSAREHHDLAALITAGKVAEVRAELHRHLQTTCSRLRSAIPPTPVQRENQP
ncbi:GntR family transcriptional regulator [Micromonospora yangpuensis]|uniref:Transcriptional regulator, GntR family n=1 Tax=Micromonospora yangpuensis TaxID=683228 RepID=A0A1C6V4F4_9ACTN|nr:GntR family transcriptional regulator [Micromonospora yangpuensis]GGM15646.1 GntR family transcriptional regulator [Micromonospora yangpuensis]SCL61118.1 transcriptional regulator, GntR family [Micromonospora yangpuensis]